MKSEDNRLCSVGVHCGSHETRNGDGSEIMTDIHNVGALLTKKVIDEFVNPTITKYIEKINTGPL